MIEPGSEAMLEFLLFLLGFENGFVREKNRRVESIFEKNTLLTHKICVQDVLYTFCLYVRMDLSRPSDQKLKSPHMTILTSHLADMLK